LTTKEVEKTEPALVVPCTALLEAVLQLLKNKTRRERESLPRIETEWKVM